MPRNHQRRRTPCRKAIQQVLDSQNDGDGWTKETLIRKATISKTLVKDVCRGTPSTLFALKGVADALGVSVDDICQPDADPEDSSSPQLSRTGTAQEESGNERLLSIVSEILSRSDAARKLILRHNSFPDDLDAAELAAAIFSAERPMELLFKCVDQPIDKAHRFELNEAMPLLAGALAPRCLSPENYSQLQQYCEREFQDDPTEPAAEIGTK